MSCVNMMSSKMVLKLFSWEKSVHEETSKGPSVECRQ